MERPQVTGGEVSFMQRVRTGEYEHAETKATLTFAIPEGADYRDYFDQLAAEVKTKVRQNLGLETAPARSRKPPIAPPVVKTEPVAVVDPKAQEMQAAVIAVVEEPSAPLASSAAPSPSIVPSVEVPSLPTTDAASVVPDPAASVVADDSIADEWVAQREVTDKELGEAAAARNGIIKDARPIKALLAKYAPEQATLRAIPQDKRHQFLAELAALQPAGKA